MDARAKNIFFSSPPFFVEKHSSFRRSSLFSGAGQFDSCCFCAVVVVVVRNDGQPTAGRLLGSLLKLTCLDDRLVGWQRSSFKCA